MMNKSYDTASRVTLPAPAGGVKSGNFYRFGALFGCAVASAPEGRPFTLDREGIWNVQVFNVEGVSIGDPIYFIDDAADGEPQFTSIGDPALVDGTHLVGVAVEAAEGEVTKVDVAISPMPLTIAAEAVEDAGGADA